MSDQWLNLCTTASGFKIRIPCGLLQGCISAAKGTDHERRSTLKMQASHLDVRQGGSHFGPVEAFQSNILQGNFNGLTISRTSVETWRTETDDHQMRRSLPKWPQAHMRAITPTHRSNLSPTMYNDRHSMRSCGDSFIKSRRERQRSLELVWCGGLKERASHNSCATISTRIARTTRPSSGSKPDRRSRSSVITFRCIGCCMVGPLARAKRHWKSTTRCPPSSAGFTEERGDGWLSWTARIALTMMQTGRILICNISCLTRVGCTSLSHHEAPQSKRWQRWRRWKWRTWSP